MVGHVVVALSALLAVTMGQDSPWWAWGPGIGIDRGGGRASRDRQGGILEENIDYQTCIGKNSDGDSMKVTFSRETNNNPWGGNWGRSWGITFTLRLASEIISSPSSILSGQYQMIVTEGGRTEELCLSDGLGSVLGNQRRLWFSQRDVSPRGYVGEPFVITNGQTSTHAQPIDSLTWEETIGRGVALCRSDRLQGATCMDIIPLCCKLGYDSAPATTPIFRMNRMSQLGFPGGSTLGGLAVGSQRFSSNQNRMSLGNDIGGGIGRSGMSRGLAGNGMGGRLAGNGMMGGFGAGGMGDGFGNNGMGTGIGGNGMGSNGMDQLLDQNRI